MIIIQHVRIHYCSVIKAVMAGLWRTELTWTVWAHLQQRLPPGI